MILPALRPSSLLMRALPLTLFRTPVHRLSPCLTRLISTGIPKCAESSKSSESKPKDSIHPSELPQRKENLAPNKTPVSWKSLSITVVCLGILLNVLYYLKKARNEAIDQYVAITKKKVQSVGKAAIGGPFELQDTSNKVVTDKDFLGKWVLMYFGFTHCPDICPEELEKMAKVIDFVDRGSKQPLDPLFISVDPERDTPELIKKYAAEFSPRLRGLTGTIDQIKAICKTYRIYYSAGPKEDDDYIVDHTIIMYLLNPKGEFEQYYGRNKSAEDISTDVLFRMAHFQRQNNS